MEKFIIDSGLYIDDDNLVFFVLPSGARWDADQRKMMIQEDKIQEDSQEDGDKRTMREMSKMASSVCPIIQLTEDCPGKHDDKRMPILDLKIWIQREQEEQKILFQHYRKPMATRLLMLARTAMPSRIKRASLTQEGLRILSNTSLEISWEKKAEMLTDLSLRMKLSGYGERYRLNIIQSILKAWEKKLEDHRSGVRPLYREREWREEERMKGKENKKKSWFSNQGEKKNDFPIFCPSSPGSRLAGIWKKVVEEVRMSSGGRVRATVVEKPGVKVSALLVDPLPGEDDFCGKDDCNPCTSGTTKRKSCHQSTTGGMVYEGKCDTCGEVVEDGREAPTSLYHGRTSRTLYTRVKEHEDGYRKKKEDNPLWKHREKFHPDEWCEFTFRAERHFKDPCSCAIYEGVCINRSPSTPDHLMNSKSEWEQGQVARVVLETRLRD